ncbi:MAG: hypothetical protein ACLFWF_15245 [Alphaproteobacteria bacterium]
MSRKWTRTAAFQYFGAKPRNIRWSWSARNEADNLVVLVLWEDRFTREDGVLTYDERLERANVDWTRFPGNSERIKNLEWAREYCNGIFHVIIAKAKDENAGIRRVVECQPDDNLRMRIVDLNEETGEFRAVSVPD